MKKEDGAELLKAVGIENTKERREQASEQAGGHPLALILLAQLVRTGNTLEQLLATKSLWQGKIAENLLDEVYTGVSSREQQMLQFTSVFGGKEIGSGDVLGMIEQLPRHSTSWSKGVIDQTALALRLKSLLNIHNDAYSLHPIVHDYAYTKLRSPRKHHRAAAGHFLQQYADTHPDAHTHPAKNLADAQPLLDAIDQFCMAGEFEDAYKVMRSTPLDYMSVGGGINLIDLLGRWGEYGRLVDVCERIINAPANVLADGSRGAVLGNLGNAYIYLGEYQQAIGYHQRALAVAEQIGDFPGKGRHMGNMGLAYVRLGEYLQAIDYLEQALAIAEQIGDFQGKSRHLGNLGIAYSVLGEYDKAINYHTRSLAIKEQIGSLNGQAASLGNLGLAYDSLGGYAKAIEYYTRCLEIAEQIGDITGQGDTWNYLGLVYERRKRYCVALACYLKALPIREHIGNPHELEETCNSIASVRAAAGEQDWPTLEAEAERLVADPNWRPWQDN